MNSLFEDKKMQNEIFKTTYNDILILKKIEVSQKQKEDFKKKLLKLTNLIINTSGTPFHKIGDDIIIVDKQTDYYWIAIKVTASMGINFNSSEELLTLSDINIDIETLGINAEKFQLFHNPKLNGVKEKIERIIQHDTGKFNNIIESVIDEKIIELG